MNDFLKKRMAHILADRPLPEKKKYRIAPKSAKRMAKEAAQVQSGTESPQDLWFKEKMATSEAKCSECGMVAEWLKQPQYAPIWKACQAHILPKKKRYGFPSIATHPDNHMVLFPSWGGHLCGCHGFYDSNWYNSSTMKIWPQVLKTIMEKLLPKIAPEERKNIPDIFIKEL